KTTEFEPGRSIYTASSETGARPRLQLLGSLQRLFPAAPVQWLSTPEARSASIQSIPTARRLQLQPLVIIVRIWACTLIWAGDVPFVGSFGQECSGLSIMAFAAFPGPNKRAISSSNRVESKTFLQLPKALHF